MQATLLKIKAISPVPKQEKGMAMVIALLMGVALAAGATGLALRQIMARRLGASESYQQMAESAALSGLNRILSDLNRDDRNNYTGFLLTLNNDEGEWGWAKPNSQGFELIELCTPVTQSIDAYPSTSSSDAPEIPINTGTMRNDGITGSIQTTYRLRSYNTTASAGNGQGTFLVEGIVRRGDALLARAVLKRSLYINSKVAGAGDWGVISGHNLRLNDTDIIGAGNIFYLTKSPSNYAAEQYASGCSSSNLLSDVGATNSTLAGKNLTNQIWPINIDEANRGVSGMPPLTLFERERVNDTTEGSDGKTIRLWSIDDSAPAPADRNGDGIEDTLADGTPIRYPALPCGEVVCLRDADQADLGDYGITNSGSFRTASEEGISLSSDGSTITLTTDILCKESAQFDCHIYFDHLRLDNKKLHIETSDTRAVVLHIEQPQSYPNDPKISRAFSLSGTAELCSVNEDGSTCNGKPERFVIAASSGSAPTDACNTEPRSLRFTGTTLPYALLYMPTGTVRPSDDASLSGLIWASSVCVVDNDDDPASFTLKTEHNDIPIVQRANDLWGWSSRINYPGYGRMVTRAIRGTSLDTFERW